MLGGRDMPRTLKRSSNANPPIPPPQVISHKPPKQNLETLQKEICRLYEEDTTPKKSVFTDKLFELLLNEPRNVGILVQDHFIKGNGVFPFPSLSKNDQESINNTISFHQKCIQSFQNKKYCALNNVNKLAQ